MFTATTYSVGKAASDCGGDLGLTEATRCINLEIEADGGVKVKEDVCVCYYAYGMVHPASVSTDSMCFTAECMMHADACSGWSGATIIFFLLLLVLLVLGLFTIAWSAFVTCKLKKTKGSLGNAAGTSVVFAFLGAIFATFWVIGYFPGLFQRELYLVNVLYVIGISGAAIFCVASALNMSLMWLQVARSAKTLKKGTTNLGRGPIAFVATFAITFALAIIVLFGIMQNNIIGGGLAWVAVIGLLTTFQIGVRQIVKATSKPGQPPSAGLQRITRMNRRFMVLMVFYSIGCLGYAGMLIVLRTRRSNTLGAIMSVFIFFILSQILLLCGFIAKYVFESTRKKKKVAPSSSNTAASTRRASSAATDKTANTTTTTTTAT